MTHEIRYSVREPEHDDSIKNADVDPEFERVGCNDPEKISGKGLLFDAPSVLSGSVSLTWDKTTGQGTTS